MYGARTALISEPPWLGQWQSTWQHMHGTLNPSIGRSCFNYLRFAPEHCQASTPLIVYLHGAGERGSDLSLVTRYGLPALVANGSVLLNCSLVCPQLEANGVWDAERIQQFLKAVSVDPQKTALVGYSLGASGVCAAIGQYGCLAATTIAIAGQAHAELVTANQVGTQFLAIQGELDTWARTRAFVSRVLALGGEAQSVTLQGMGHYVSEDAVFHQSVVGALARIGIEVHARQGACANQDYLQLR